MTPFSCAECRTELAALVDDANPSARLETTGVNEMSSETAAHLQSCADCRREYSILRGIVGELRALPSFAAPPDLRARVRNQIALETTNETAGKVAAASTTASPRTTPRTMPRRSLLPRFFIPRWATYSLSGAVLTAFLLFVTRDMNPDFTPSRESYNTSSSVRRAASSQSGPAKTRVAPRPEQKTPSAANNSTNGKNALNNGALPQSSTSQKAAPVPQSSASSAPSSTRSATTAPTTTVPEMTAPAANAPAAKTFRQPAPNQSALNQTKNGNGNSSVSGGSAPQVTAPEEPSEPRLLPSLPGDSTPAARRDTSTQRDKTTAASQANAPGSSPPAPLGNDEASSASAKRFARLELLPPSAAPSSSQKVQPTRTEDSSVRRQGLFANPPSLSKSAANDAGAFSADASSAGTASAPTGSASVSGALSSAQSRTGSDATSAARPSPNASQSAGDASPAQPDERAYRSRVADAGARSARPDAPEPSASTEAAPSAMQDGSTRPARGSVAPSGSPAPTSRATARSNTSNYNSNSETASNTPSGSFSAPADAAATPIPKPLLPAAPRRTFNKKAAVSTRSAKGLNEENLAYKTRQNARLIVMPRLNARHARVLVTWIPEQARAKTASSVVWRGAAWRNQEIVILLSAPRGNKNRRVQVSLQSANARGEWQTLDTTILSATPVAR